MDNNKYLWNCLGQCDVPELINLFQNGSQININNRDKSHGLQTPVMQLCHLDISAETRQDLLELMLQLNPDLNLQDSSGRTVLHHACIGHCLDVLKTVSHKDCEAGITDLDGNTPLIVAVRSGNAELLEVFLEAFGHFDLKPFHRNSKGLTAFDEADHQKSGKIQQILAAHFDNNNTISSSQNYVGPNGSKGQEKRMFVTERITCRQLRKNQSERLAPVVNTHHTPTNPNFDKQRYLTKGQDRAKNKALPQRNASTVLPGKEEHRQLDTAVFTEINKSYDEIEQGYFADFCDSQSSSEGSDIDTYSDDDFCEDSIDHSVENLEISQDLEETITNLQFKMALPQRPVKNFMSLPDLCGQSGLVGSSNPSSSGSVHSEGANVRRNKTLQEKYSGATKEELSLPRLVEISQDSSSDETSDDSYTEPLTPRSKAAHKKDSFSLPEMAKLTNFGITPRGVDIVFTTDSEGSAPNTFRAACPKNSDSLPQINASTVKSLLTSRINHQGNSTNVTGNSPRGHLTHVIKDQPNGSWIRSKLHRKAEMRLVSANCNR